MQSGGTVALADARLDARLDLVRVWARVTVTARARARVRVRDRARVRVRVRVRVNISTCSRSFSRSPLSAAG